jgi:hypothetical protein
MSLLFYVGATFLLFYARAGIGTMFQEGVMFDGVMDGELMGAKDRGEYQE